MTEIIDTHCHLYLDEFREDLDQVIQRAESEGIRRFFMPAIDSSETSNLLAVEQRFKGKCIPMMGLHPCSVKENYEEELRIVERWLLQRKFAAVGEIGLDYYWDLSFKSQQVLAFQQQIELAIAQKLPIVIHSRKSLEDCIEMVSRYNGQLTGIYHCFSGSIEQANAIIKQGFYLGIGGVITYKNAGLDKVIKDVPLENIVLETDAPYLTPVPFRGKRNEPSYLRHVIKKISEVKGEEEDEIARITALNAERIFAEVSSSEGAE